MRRAGWQGQPLTSHKVVLNYIRTTRNDSGLKCKAYLDKHVYKTGKTLTQEQIDTMNLHPNRNFPLKNYTIRPRST